MKIVDRIYNFIDPYIIEDDKEIDIEDYTYDIFNSYIGRYCKIKPNIFIYPEGITFSILYLHMYDEVELMKINIKKLKIKLILLQ